MFRDAGCDEVRTYIQSGNVVFEANAALAGRVPALVARAIARKFHFDSPIAIRTVAELGAVVRNNPFLKHGADLKALHVAFLLDTPGKAAVAGLEPDRSPGDEFAVRGRDIYLHCPNGMGRTKLTNLYFDSRLKTVSTARNWNTVMTLLEMVRGA
jgi:uncharacterized protein (DUF1697 family)